MEEIWKDIPGYEGLYQASNFGRIKSLSRIAKKKYRGNRIVKERIMMGTKNKDGYLKVHFKNKEKDIDKGLFVHRLIAQTFILNPNNLEQINHKDGNKINNKVENLEWCTNQENQIHAWKNNLQKRKYGKENKLSKKVNQYDLEGNFIKEYESVTLASKETKVSVGNISSVLNGKRNKAGGYKWTYTMNYKTK